MTVPLHVSTDNSAEIAKLRAEIAALKAGAMNQDAYAGRARIPGGRDPSQWQAQIDELQRQLDALLNPNLNVGPNLSAAPPAAPVFAGVNLDTSRVGVDALKLLSYPGFK